MDNNKAIEVLNMLKDYVNENWDDEYRKDIDDVNELHDYLLHILSNSTVVGSAVVNGKSYLIIGGDHT